MIVSRLLIIMLMVFISVARAQPSAALGSEVLGANRLGLAGHSAFMPIHGFTSPPVGHVDFCRRHPDECEPRRVSTLASSDDRRIGLTAERWHMLIEVNSYINALITPKTDMELYNVEEFWTYPTHAGDCEDYVLLKRRELMKRGWPESALLITVVRDETGEGHAVLTVRTADGDYILDNKHSRVLLWRETPYQYIKRQSYRHPKLWVSLMPAAESPAVGAARTSR
jgi:predicted transglutaminase-like cysteine proteinase